jgi:SSS family solute:Na+ symporter
MILSLADNRWATREGAAAGIVAGVATVVAIGLTRASIGTLFPSLPVEIKEINVGIIALVVNVLVLIAVSLGTRLLTGNHRRPAQAADLT